MKKITRSVLVLAAAVSVAGAMGFAQGTGEATYKTKCQSCHGPAGVPSAGMAKMMGIKAASDPDIQKLSVADIIGVVKTGKGKMKPVAGLSDDQVKDVSTYNKGLK